MAIIIASNIKRDGLLDNIGCIDAYTEMMIVNINKKLNNPMFGSSFVAITLYCKGYCPWTVSLFSPKKRGD